MHQSLDSAWQDLQRGKYRRALRGFQKLVELERTNSQAYLGSAWCYNALSQPEQAAIAALRALELDSLLVDPHIILASVHKQKRRYDECEKEIQKALSLDPDSAYAHHMLGLQLLNKEQFPEAVEKMKKAIAVKPEHSAFHISLAMAYQKMGNHTAAVREYRNALEYSRSFEAVANVILSSVGYYRWMVAILLLLPVIIRSIYSLPLMIASSGYIALNAWLYLQHGKYKWGIGAIAVFFSVTAVYIYHLLYGL